MAVLGKYRKLLGIAGTESIIAFLGLISGVLVARHLGAEGRGSVAAVMVTLTVLSWLVYFGVPNAAGYMSTVKRSSVVGLAAVIATALGTVAGIVLWFVAPGVTSDYPVQVEHGMRAAALLLPFVGLAYCGQEILYAESRIGTWNFLRSIPPGLPSVGIVALSLTDHLTLGTAIGVYLGAMVVYVVGSCTALAGRVSSSLVLADYRRIFGYALPRWASAASDAITARLDQVLMVGLSSPAELGRYAVAVTAVSVANPLSKAVGLLMYPSSRNAAEGSDTTEMHRRTRRRAVVLSAVSGGILALVGAPLVELVFGDQFSGLGLIILLLVLGQILNDRYFVDILYFAGIGKPEKLVAPSWATAGIALALLLLLGRDGLTGVEAASVALGCAAVRCAGIEWVTRRMRGEAAPHDSSAAASTGETQ